jgi:glycosyltransferase involved in cell wall biosynthesis
VNILLLNHYAGTPELGMEFRPFYLAREWVRLGHRVQVLAANYSHVRAQQPQGAAPGQPADENVQGVAYRWYAAPAYQGNGLGRVKNIATFLRAVWADTPRLVSQFKPDVVIASSTYPMDIWIARRLARLAGAKLVYEVHDLWPLSPMELSGLSRHHPFIRLCQWAEDTAYRDADVVVSMLPKVHDYMASRGLDLKRLHIVPNGITLDEWAGEPPALAAEPAAALAIARAQGRTVVGYAGSMGKPNALDTWLDAAALLKHERFAFVAVGNGHERAHLLRRVAQAGLQHVALLPPIPKDQVPAFLTQVDVAYIGWQPVSLYRFGIAPNKLMDYMMARCPVLHSVRAGNDPVAEAGCGLTVPPQDAAAVAQGLRRLAALPPAERRAMGERGRAFVLAQHTYPVLAQRFLEALR